MYCVEIKLFGNYFLLHHSRLHDENKKKNPESSFMLTKHIFTSSNTSYILYKAKKRVSVRSIFYLPPFPLALLVVSFRLAFRGLPPSFLLPPTAIHPSSLLWWWCGLCIIPTPLPLLLLSHLFPYSSKLSWRCCCNGGCPVDSLCERGRSKIRLSAKHLTADGGEFPPSSVSIARFCGGV